MRACRAAIGVAVVALIPDHAPAAESSMALGRHLAQECTTCHRLDGHDNGIPSIIGLEADYFVETLNFYKNGQRTNPAMVSVAQSLDDEQIKALSLYFGSLQKPQPPASSATAGASKGKERKR
jgi:cytochrome c553